MIKLRAVVVTVEDNSFSFMMLHATEITNHLNNVAVTLKLADLKSQKCRCAWYSHISSQFMMVKQNADVVQRFPQFQS